MAAIKLRCTTGNAPDYTLAVRDILIGRKEEDSPCQVLIETPYVSCK